MKNKIIALFLITLAAMPAVAFAVPKSVSTYDGNAKPNGNAGKSTVGHLYLVEKDPDGVDNIASNADDWTIVQDGAWGKMNYNTKNQKFVFDGHKLNSKTGYSLIYYPDPWPGKDCQVLGTGATNKGGSVHISGKFNFNSIPITGDTNTPGSKIWLVLSSDVSCPAGMTAWNPAEYLFEYSLI